MRTCYPEHQPAVDLSTCDREPIHVPGAIQPHGVLLALEEPSLRIHKISENVRSFFRLEPDDVLERPLEKVIEAAHLEHVIRALNSERPQDHNPLPLMVRGRGFDGLVHRYQGHTILELEATPPDGHRTVTAMLPALVKSIIAQLQGATSLQTLLDAVAHQVRALTGFDRVLVYRFDRDEHGSVVAEERDPVLEPYLGLRYPASDIPQQARRLYLLNWLRLIPDALYTPVPIVAAKLEQAAAPLDLSLSVLRSVSPIHLEYLKNMGSRASMSISLIREGRLWGLISCGHRTPKYIPHALRDACELIGRVTSIQIAALEETERRTYLEHSRALLAALETSLREADDILVGLAHHPRLLELLPAGGAAVYLDGRCITAGETPDQASIEALVHWLQETPRAPVFSCDALPRLYPPAVAFKEVASGLLAVSLPKPSMRYALWFRPEVIRTVHWGGNPEKPVEVIEGEPRLHPRRSFALWQEEVRMTSAPWHPLEVEIAGALRRHAIEVDLERQVLIEREARAAFEASQSRFQFMREAGTLLTASLDLETTLATIARAATTEFSDVCAIDLLDDRGCLQRVKVLHRDPATQGVSERLAHFDLPDASIVPPPGRSRLEPQLTREKLTGRIDPDQVRLLWDVLNVRSVMFVRLEVRDRDLGTLCFMNTASSRRFDRQDLELAEELGRRAAIAIENARLYQEAQQAIEEAIAAVRGREELIAVISHDLRNPLSALMLQSSLVLRTLSSDDSAGGRTLRARLLRIQQSAAHMQGLVQDLLDMARIEAGQFAVELATVRVDEVWNGIVDLMMPLAEQRSVRLVAVPVAADLAVRADRKRLSQVISNLIGNALRFTPAGGTVRVSAEPDGREVRFAVKDDGPGIPPERQRYLFERYWHAGLSDGGAGLGLYIARGIIDAHGGRIWLESEVGKCSTFYFTLPRPTPEVPESRTVDATGLAGRASS